MIVLHGKSTVIPANLNNRNDGVCPYTHKAFGGNGSEGVKLTVVVKTKTKRKVKGELGNLKS